jgi:hypothetical protein
VDGLIGPARRDEPSRHRAISNAYPTVEEEALEQHLRGVARRRGCELVVERLSNGRWRAAFVQSGVTLQSAERSERRGALDDLRVVTPMAREIHSIEKQRTVSIIIALVAVAVFIAGAFEEPRDTAEVVGAVALGVIALAVRWRAERRGDLLNWEVRRHLTPRPSGAEADDGVDLAYTLREMMPLPGDSRRGRQYKLRAARNFVARLDNTQSWSLATTLARMIVADTRYVTTYQREYLTRLRAEATALLDDPVPLPRFDPTGIILFAAMTADPLDCNAVALFPAATRASLLGQRVGQVWSRVRPGPTRST